MNKIAIFFPLFLVFSVSFAQNKKSNQQNSTDQVFLNSYKLSRDVKDHSSARMAAMTLYFLTGQNNWQDTLSMLYLKSGMYESNVELGSQILARFPENVFVRYNKAVSEFALDSLENALEDFSYIYGKTGKSEHLFYKIWLECAIGKTADCLSSIDKLQRSPGYKDLKVSLKPWEEKELMPAEAAILFLQANILIKQEEKQPALKLLEEALKMYPDFEEAADLKETLIKG